MDLVQSLRDFLGTVGGGLADFFGEFTPANWTTSSLSLAAILLSLWASYQAQQAQLRPDLKLGNRWREPATYYHPVSGPVEEELIEVTVTNRGAGDAVNVIVTFTGGRPQSLGTLSRDDSKTASVNSIDLPGSQPFTYKVTWKEYPPRNGKERSKTGSVTAADPMI